MQGNLNELMKEVPPEIARNVARFGVKLAIDLLQTLYADLGGEQPAAQPVRKKRGRPRISRKKVDETLAHKGWPADPEERKREMARRVEVRRAKVAREAKSAGAKKRWDKMSATQKAAWQRAMPRGREQRKEAA